MPMFYNDQQAGVPWQGLPPMARPSPQGQSQVYSGLPATATANAPVAPPQPTAGPRNDMRSKINPSGNKPTWGGLPPRAPIAIGRP
jgi:hypothetical protein